jgi:hypothetical protein
MQTRVQQGSKAKHYKTSQWNALVSSPNKPTWTLSKSYRKMTSTTAMFPQRFMWLVISAVLLTLSGSMVVEAAPPTSVLQPEKFTEPNLDLSLSLPRHDSHVDTNLRLGSIYPTSAQGVGADDSTKLRANGGRYASGNSERTLKDPRIDPEMGELPLSLAPPGPRALVAAGKRPMSARLQSEMDAPKTPGNQAPITLQKVDGDEAGSSSAPGTYSAYSIKYEITLLTRPPIYCLYQPRLEPPENEWPTPTKSRWTLHCT